MTYRPKYKRVLIAFIALAVILAISHSVTVAAIGVWRHEIITPIVAGISQVITLVLLAPALIVGSVISPGSSFDSGLYWWIISIISILMWAIVIDWWYFKFKGQKLS
jgi:hypothetical protein